MKSWHTIIISLVISITSFSTLAQQRCECKYVDFGDKIIRQKTILQETDSTMITIQVDSVQEGFMEKLEKKIPGNESVVHVDWGTTTMVLTDTGEAVIFRKCTCSK